MSVQPQDIGMGCLKTWEYRGPGVIWAMGAACLGT
jgi:hypothetical protein